MSQKLSGKVALVTGGTSGIGLATTKQFFAEGAYVFIAGRRQTELDASVKEIGCPQLDTRPQRPPDLSECGQPWCR